jgi:hypothetical protein
MTAGSEEEMCWVEEPLLLTAVVALCTCWVSSTTLEMLSKEDDSERALLRVVHPAKGLFACRAMSPAGAVFGRAWSGVLTACMVDG